MNAPWVQSDVGFHGPACMMDYIEHYLHGSLMAAEAGIPQDESPNHVVAALLLIELARALPAQISTWWNSVPAKYRPHPAAGRSLFSSD